MSPLSPRSWRSSHRAVVTGSAKRKRWAEVKARLETFDRKGIMCFGATALFSVQQLVGFSLQTHERAYDDDARTEWASLRRLLDRVPDEATVWPGHDYGVRPSSTIGLERATNPFLRCPDLTAFITLKRDWPAVKQRLGLK